MFRSVCVVVLVFTSLPVVPVRAEQEAIAVIVVESEDWASATNEISGDHLDLIVWSEGHPKWFSSCVSQDAPVLVLSCPANVSAEREMWRERLAVQGCRLLTVKVSRTSGKVEANQIFACLHSALVETFPEKKAIWDANYRRALRNPPVRTRKGAISWLAKASNAVVCFDPRM